VSYEHGPLIPLTKRGEQKARLKRDTVPTLCLANRESRKVL